MATSQDLEKGIDITGLTTVTGSELNQLVDAGRVASDKGLIIETTDSALDTPVVPNPDVLLEGVTPTWWKRYQWKRNPHTSAGASAKVKTYQWNPNKVVDATLLQWEWMEEVANTALTNAAAALTAANNAQSTANVANANSVIAQEAASEALDIVNIVNNSLIVVYADQTAIVTGTPFYLQNSGSTNSALIMKYQSGLFASGLLPGLTVRFIVPLTIGFAPVTLQLKDPNGTNIDTAKTITKFGRINALTNAGQGDLIAGQMVQLTYDGVQWQITSDSLGTFIPANLNLTNGLVITNNAGNPNTQIDIGISEVLLTHGAGGGNSRVLTGVSITLNSALGVALNGLDTGTIADGWYHMWLIYNVATNTVSGVLSLSDASPDATFLSTNGITHKLLLGAVSRISGNFFQFYQVGRKVSLYRVALFDGLDPAASNTYEGLGVTPLALFEQYIPAIAKRVRGNMGKVDTVTEGAHMSVAADSSGLQEQTFTALQGNAFNDWSVASPYELPLKTRNIYWKGLDNNTNAYRLEITGFEI